MTKKQNSKRYDLEDRTLEYGKRIIKMAKALPKRRQGNNLLVPTYNRS